MCRTFGRFAPAAKTGSLAIVGGTGVYAGAAGTQSVTWLGAQFARSKVVFESGT